jgi:formate dehydrogenase iron-sulfur subunit
MTMKTVHNGQPPDGPAGRTICSAAAPQVTSPGRREFLQHAGGSIAAFVLATSLTGAAEASDGAPSPEGSANAQGILIDLTRCGGCQQCALACKAANGCDHADAIPTALAVDAYSVVEVIEAGGAAEATATVKRQCMHCLKPACVSACTVGALQKRPDGPVVYDASRCIGCRYCQYACPFGVPVFDWDNPLGLIHKCQMCANRLDEGQLPACVAACPNGALRAGQRTALLAQARGQIESNPGRYVDHIYGEWEAGGTSILYLSDVPFARLGFPTLDGTPIPTSAEAMMRRTPTIALGMATLATTLHLITRLRQRALAVEEAGAVPSAKREGEAP